MVLEIQRTMPRKRKIELGASDIKIPKTRIRQTRNYASSIQQNEANQESLAQLVTTQSTETTHGFSNDQPFLDDDTSYLAVQDEAHVANYESYVNGHTALIPSNRQPQKFITMRIWPEMWIVADVDKNRYFFVQDMGDFELTCSCLLSGCPHERQVSYSQPSRCQSVHDVPHVLYLGICVYNLFLVFKNTIVVVKDQNLWCQRHFSKQCLHTLSVKNIMLRVFGITDLSLEEYTASNRDDECDSYFGTLEEIQNNLAQGKLPLPNWSLLIEEEPITWNGDQISSGIIYDVREAFNFGPDIETTGNKRLVKLTNKSACTIRMLWDLCSYLISRSSVGGFIKHLTRIYQSEGSIYPFLSKAAAHKLLKPCLNRFALYEAQNLCCVICQWRPGILVLDATSIRFKRRCLPRHLRSSGIPGESKSRFTPYPKLIGIKNGRKARKVLRERYGNMVRISGLRASIATSRKKVEGQISSDEGSDTDHEGGDIPSSDNFDSYTQSHVENSSDNLESYPDTNAMASSDIFESSVDRTLKSSSDNLERSSSTDIGRGLTDDDGSPFITDQSSSSALENNSDIKFVTSSEKVSSGLGTGKRFSSASLDLSGNDLGVGNHQTKRTDGYSSGSLDLSGDDWGDGDHQGKRTDRYSNGNLDVSGDGNQQAKRTDNNDDNNGKSCQDEVLNQNHESGEGSSSGSLPSFMLHADATLQRLWQSLPNDSDSIKHCHHTLRLIHAFFSGDPTYTIIDFIPSRQGVNMNSELIRPALAEDLPRELRYSIIAVCERLYVMWDTFYRGLKDDEPDQTFFQGYDDNNRPLFGSETPDCAPGLKVGSHANLFMDGYSCFFKRRAPRCHDDRGVHGTVICSKKFPQSKQLNGGLLLMFCHHGVCYGFKILGGAETIKDTFDLSLNHIPPARSTLIYDFACSLWRYALHRQPKYLLENSISFKVDRFHLQNHSCGPCIELDTSPVYGNIGSSIAETRNSLLGFLKSIVGSSSFKGSLTSISSVVSLYNRSFNRRLQMRRRVQDK